jgi:hypothetical protein
VFGDGSEEAVFRFNVIARAIAPVGLDDLLAPFGDRFRLPCWIFGFSIHFLVLPVFAWCAIHSWHP